MPSSKKTNTNANRAGKAAIKGTQVLPFKSNKSTIHGRRPHATSTLGQSSGKKASHALVQQLNEGANLSGTFKVSVSTFLKMTLSRTVKKRMAAVTEKSVTLERTEALQQNGLNLAFLNMKATIVVPRPSTRDKRAVAMYE
mmetsp:Transcript_15574/g.23334  ORF Transcript_15574/g.23334 Transcript_15574/m.23334 type:complete len:141 (+) Transcript_15574:136-558(+)